MKIKGYIKKCCLYIITNKLEAAMWFFITVAIIMIGLYLFQFVKYGLSESLKDWADFGSYFGSITGILAFSGVLYSASLSEKRARKAEEESKRREERDQFLKMLDIHIRHKDKFFGAENIDANIILSEILLITQHITTYKFFKENIDDKESDFAERSEYERLLKTHSITEFVDQIESKFTAINQTETYKWFTHFDNRVLNYFISIKNKISNELQYEIFNLTICLILRKYPELYSFYKNFNCILEFVPNYLDNSNYMKLINNQLTVTEKILLLYYYIGMGEDFIFFSAISNLNYYHTLEDINPNYILFVENNNVIDSNKYINNMLGGLRSYYDKKL